MKHILRCNLIQFLKNLVYAIYTRRMAKTYYVMIYYRSFLHEANIWFVDTNSKCVWSLITVQIKSYLDPDLCDKSMENFGDFISFVIALIV